MIPPLNDFFFHPVFKAGRDAETAWGAMAWDLLCPHAWGSPVTQCLGLNHSHWLCPWAQKPNPTFFLPLICAEIIWGAWLGLATPLL